MDCEVGSNALRDTVWEVSVRLYGKAPRAFKDLDPRQQYQLAALVVDTIAYLEERREYQRSDKWGQKLRKELPRQSRMLKRKEKKVTQALQDLHDYTANIEGILGGERKRAASASQKIFSEIRPMFTQEHIPPPIKIVESSGPLPKLPSSPIAAGMIQLYWFFRHGCSLPGDEAEVRVAMIRNRLWTEYGVASVGVRYKYDGAGESKGCGAVQEAVRRFRPDRGTTR